MAIKLEKGETYDLDDLQFARWSDGEAHDQDHDRLDWTGWFRDGRYLGPDDGGIEPLFDIFD